MVDAAKMDPSLGAEHVLNLMKTQATEKDLKMIKPTLDEYNVQWIGYAISNSDPAVYKNTISN